MESCNSLIRLDFNKVFQLSRITTIPHSGDAGGAGIGQLLTWWDSQQDLRWSPLEASHEILDHQGCLSSACLGASL